MTLSLLLIIMDDSSTFFVTLSLLLIIMDGSSRAVTFRQSRGGWSTDQEGKTGLPQSCLQVSRQAYLSHAYMSVETRQAYLSHAYRLVDSPTLVMPTGQ